jgi:hypothetical protein
MSKVEIFNPPKEYACGIFFDIFEVYLHTNFYTYSCRDAGELIILSITQVLYGT